MWNLYPTMLQEQLLTQVRALNAQRLERLARIKNRQQAQQYCADVSRKIARCFGPRPRKTPLNVRETCKEQCQGYSRTNIVFESRPGYWVTGNLYEPLGSGKVPVVLGCCGHSFGGKVEYQPFCISLAQQGYMVFIADPLSQGERWQYAADDIPGKLWKGQSCTNEHNVLGKAQRLTGEFFGMWRVWDKIRALDVLLAHPRADLTRVGITGNSGGGTLTSYVTALESRATMAAPSCYITSFQHNLENSLPCDAEQMIPNMLAGGMEMIDLILARAPRPTILLGQKYDFFDPRGTEQAFEQAKKIYRLLGAEDNIALFIGPEGHGYGIDNRQAMYDFFNKHAGVKSSGRESKLTVKPVAEEKLLAADGDVNAQGSRPAWQFNAEKARELKAAQPKMTKADKLKKLEKLLQLPKRKQLCHYRNSQVAWGDMADADPETRVVMTQYLVETEPGILAVLNRHIVSDYKQCFRLEPPRELTLFLRWKAAEDYDVPTNTMLGRKTHDAWVLDVRGFGASEPQSLAGHDITHPYGMDYMMASTCDMMGYPLVGRRVHDALCVLDVLVSCGAKKITLVASDQAAVVATFAAALHKNVKKLELDNPPESFFDLTQKPLSPALVSNVVPGFLKYFDWTDFVKLV